MANKSLLTPRYLILIETPFCELKKGQILEQKRMEDALGYEIAENYMVDDAFMARYPEVFRPLRWYQFRNHMDMPGYLKDARTESGSDSHEVRKVHSYSYSGDIVEFADVESKPTRLYLPASLDEYVDYQKKIHN